MKKFTQIAKYGSGSVLAMYGMASHAALSSEVTTALGDVKTDGVAAAGLVLVAIVAIFAIKLIRKAL
jgi:Inovirus Coat protein B